MTKNVIKGRDFITKIAPLVGVEPDRIQKIVIEATYNGLILVYIRLLGDERLLGVDMTDVELKVIQ